MSESVGLKKLLRRKIEAERKRAGEVLHEARADMDDYSSGPVSYLSSDDLHVPGAKGEFKFVADRFELRDHTGRVYLSTDALHVPGAKDDKAKPMAGVLLDFSRALQTVVDVGTYGAKKYTRTGWATVPEGSQRYLDAMMRHLLAMDVDQDGLDTETGLPHLAHVAWNALAVLELQARRKETY